MVVSTNGPRKIPPARSSNATKATGIVTHLVVVVPDSARVLSDHPHAQVQVNNEKRSLPYCVYQCRKQPFERGRRGGKGKHR